MFEISKFIIRMIRNSIVTIADANNARNLNTTIDPSYNGVRTWPDSLKVTGLIDAPKNDFSEMVLREPHTLIAGTTGSGKSVLVHSIVYSSLLHHPYEAELILIDLKQVELFRYSSIPFRILRYADDCNSTIDALRFADSIVRHRLVDMKEQGLTKSKNGDIYIVIDELADMIQMCGKEALMLLTSIGRLGRCANVHFIAATQSPDRKNCPACLAQNATLRIGLRCQTAIESRQIINQSGAQLLPRYGEALVLKDGYVNRQPIQMVREEDISERINFWKNKVSYIDGVTEKVIIDAIENE